jgi:hypothetical protein
VRVMDLERRGSEGGTPMKGRRAATPTKSRRMTGSRCSGELWECRLRKVACGFDGSGVDGRRRGETGTGQRPPFVLKRGSMVRVRVGKRGGVGMGTSTWRREKEGSAWAHPRCRANRGG